MARPSRLYEGAEQMNADKIKAIAEVIGFEKDAEFLKNYEEKRND